MSSTTVSSERDNLVGALCGDLSLKQVVERRPLVLSKRVEIFCGDKDTFVEKRWWGLNDGGGVATTTLRRIAKLFIKIVKHLLLASFVFLFYAMSHCTASPIWRLTIRYLCDYEGS